MAGSGGFPNLSVRLVASVQERLSLKSASGCAARKSALFPSLTPDMAVHGFGSVNSPIVIDDEEDDALDVEQQLVVSR